MISTMNMITRGPRAILALRVTLVGLLGATLLGCKQEEPPPPPAPAAAPLAQKGAAPPPIAPGTTELPAGHPPLAGAAPKPAESAPLPAGHPPVAGMPQAQGAMSGMPAITDRGTGQEIEAPTDFEGVRLTPDTGWKAMRPKASAGGISSAIAIFVLPGEGGEPSDATVRMTYFPGMRNIPIDSNLARWHRALSQPDGKPTASVATTETFTTEGGVKVTATDFTGSLGQATGLRMVAAELAHPKGPHYLKILGPEATIAKWHDSIMAYMKSATVIE